jgi:hypothetical protein
MRIRNYNQFISENQSEVEESGFVAQKEDEFTDLKEDIKSKIIDSNKVDIKSEGDEFIKEFIERYTVDSEKYKLKNLENNSDIYEFYSLNYQDIDMILSKEKFFKMSPSDMSIFSLYDYTIKATETAIKWLMQRIIEELRSMNENIEEF